jgi:hypothetical protein
MQCAKTKAPWSDSDGVAQPDQAQATEQVDAGKDVFWGADVSGRANGEYYGEIRRRSFERESEPAQESGFDFY